jgi:hypothetical protein
MHATLLSSSRPKLGGMTTREKAHKLLDELPESEIEPIVEIMASRGATEQTSQSDALEFLQRLDAGEDDGYDFSVSEQLHAER